MKMGVGSWLCGLLLWCGPHATMTDGGAAVNSDSRAPQPHTPTEPVIYPADYCEKISDDDQFDFIVVGAGPAGVAVSRRLAEDPKMKVLLMEGGDDPKSSSDIPTSRDAATDLWELKTEPSDQQCAGYPDKSCTYVLAKVLGGCSIVNLMMYARGNTKDYDEWGSKPGCQGWSWKDMFPYFLKLENYKDPLHLSKPEAGYHNTGGPFTTSPSQIDPQSNELRQAMLHEFNKLGIPTNNDFNGKSQIGVGSVTGLLEENGYRGNVAKAYLLNLPDNMKLCKNAVVHRVVFNGKTATGVEYSHKDGGKKTVKMAKDVIISGGALSSPQILERSGIGNETILKKAGVKLLQPLAGVGENLQEQFTNIGCAFQVNFKTAAARNPLSTALTSFTIFLNMTDYKNPVPDIQWLFVPYSPAYMKFKPEIAAQYAAASKDKSVLMIGSEILRQSNPGYVHIKGTDPKKTPSYNPNQFSDKKDAKLTVDSCVLIRKAMASPQMKKFETKPILLEECKDHKYNTPEEIMCHARLVGFPAYHMAGGTVMGSAEDKKSVVDNRMRVHGIEKLRVCDLSIMPGVPRGNTEVPSMAIGEKCADVIKKDYKK